MSSELLEPRDGLPPLLNTPDQFAAAASVLASGVGPFAIDTERASSFRYDDRAFLIQIRRRGSGTFLLDPEAYRPELSQALGPVLNKQTWVIHAAATDLPSLSWLDLRPSSIFDTELAGRLAGFDHVNLAAMIELIFDMHLEKGHGAEDWSQRPLPDSWLNYAALDVELLLELADVMAEILDNQGKLDWAEQEFDFVLSKYSTQNEPPAQSWTQLKGITTLKHREQLAVARALWMERDSFAGVRDLSPSRVLPNKVLVEIARTLPRNPQDLKKVKGFPSKNPQTTKKWHRVISQALATPKKSWPRQLPAQSGTPDRRFWSSFYPAEYELLQQIRAELDDLGAQLEIPSENLIQPASLRSIVWMSTQTGEISTTETLLKALVDFDVRPWQIEQVSHILSEFLIGR